MPACFHLLRWTAGQSHPDGIRRPHRPKPSAGRRKRPSSRLVGPISALRTRKSTPANGRSAITAHRESPMRLPWVDDAFPGGWPEGFHPPDLQLRGLAPRPGPRLMSHPRWRAPSPPRKEHRSLSSPGTPVRTGKSFHEVKDVAGRPHESSNPHSRPGFARGRLRGASDARARRCGTRSPGGCRLVRPPARTGGGPGRGMGRRPASAPVRAGTARSGCVLRGCARGRRAAAFRGPDPPGPRRSPRPGSRARRGSR